jgi:hypothetical protein
MERENAEIRITLKWGKKQEILTEKMKISPDERHRSLNYTFRQPQKSFTVRRE